jgi:hypothetical protein
MERVSPAKRKSETEEAHGADIVEDLAEVVASTKRPRKSEIDGSDTSPRSSMKIEADEEDEEIAESDVDTSDIPPIEVEPGFWDSLIHKDEFPYDKDRVISPVMSGNSMSSESSSVSDECLKRRHARRDVHFE